jgi:hypothetical protein
VSSDGRGWVERNLPAGLAQRPDELSGHDTGADFTHPDLSPNIDFAKSVSCIGGSPNTAPAAWKDDNGHGTHTRHDCRRA